MPLFLEDPKKKGHDLVSLIEMDMRGRAPALTQVEYIRNIYYGMMRRQTRYPGQSDIHLQVMASIIETIIPKLMNAFFAAEPHAHAQRIPVEVNPDETRAVERMTNWAVDVDIPNFYQTFESWQRNFARDGVAVVKTWYNFEERNALLVEEAPTMWHAGDIDYAGAQVPEDRPMLPAEILGLKFSSLEILDGSVDWLQEVPDLAGQYFTVNFAEGDVDYRDILVEFHPSRYREKINLHIYRPIASKDNVEVDLLEFEDLVVPYRARNLQTAERVTQLYWLTLSEIKQRILHEGWDISEDEFEILINQSKDFSRQERTDQGDTERLKEQKDTVTAVYGSEGRSNVAIAPYVDDKVLILEVYATEDLDGDGIHSEVIYQIPYSLRKVVKMNYLEELFPHGRRPFAELHCLPISDRFYSWSLGQMLAPVNIEVNTIINQINDAQEIINNPFFFYVPAFMPGDPKPLENILPGQGVPIGDVNGVLFPKFQQEPLANLSALDSILLFADRLVVSPQVAGSSQVRNAPRTARGTLALLSEASAKIDGFITAAQKGGWAELMYQIYALYDTYATDEKWERVTGVRRARARSKDLRDRIMFSFKGNTVNTNREVKRAMAQLLYTLLLQNPLYASDPKALLNLTRHLLNNFEGINVDELLPQVPGEAGGRFPMSQEQETNIIRQGVPLDVIPFDDDTAHLRSMEMTRRSADFANWNEHAVALYAAHAAQHQRQLLAKQQQGQVMGATGAQANNQALPLGPTQDLNALEGGVQ